MKNIYGWLALVLALALLLMPLISAKKEAAPTAGELYVPANGTDSTIRVKFEGTDEIKEMAIEEYLFGVLAAEMPVTYQTEALKAQAVAAHTFALYRKAENKNKGYDITSSFTTDQAFISRLAARERFGENADEYCNKLDGVIAEVKNKAVTYNGSIILSLYTAVSGGKTEDVSNVFGNPLPYLTPVESIGDLLCPDYLSNASFSAEDIRQKLCAPNGIESEYTAWFASPQYSASGTVLGMDFGGKTLTGAQIRDALSLKSANFETTFENGVFNFTVRGYGHLCGLSQYGANYMAMQGSTFEEILKWYYPGCEVISL